MKKNVLLEKEKNQNNQDIFEEEDSDNDEIKGFKNEPEEIKIERVKDNNKSYDKSIKIILIGDCKVGKTCISYSASFNR